MDVLSNYKEFEQDIKDAFGSLISEYNLNFLKIYEGCYELRNEVIILRFTYDRGDVSCNIRPAESREQYGYGVYPIFKYLFPYDKTFDKELIYDPRLQLFNYSDILRMHLKNVLKGDFSWLKDYLEEKERLNKMIQFVWNQFDRDNPIYIKFKSGDVSWQKDLKAYLDKNNISI